MLDVQDLYQEMIIDHGRNPRNCCKLEHPDCQAKGYNPLCGDEITLYLEIKDDIITNVGFEANGCAISVASASLMSEAIKGKTVAEADTIFANFHKLVTVKDQSPTELGKLNVLAGVKSYPSRVKCATLAWHTLRNAIQAADQKVIATTE